jgi:hypothetical protein
VDKDLRASLVAAGSAAALSALVGAFAGVGILTLFLRAIVGAVLIGAAVYGAVTLLRSLLPGLLPEGEKADDFAMPRGGDEPEKGANVDIVLPGETMGTESYVEADEISDYVPIGRPGAGSAKSRAAAEALLDPEATELYPVDETSLLDAEGGDAVAAMPAASSPSQGRRPSVGFDDLDVLPDLEGFSDSFTASEFNSGGSSAANGQQKSYGVQGSSGSRSGQEGLDPASLAQAVRTILKRDQKG